MINDDELLKPQRGGLPRPVVAEERGDLIFVDIEGEIVDGDRFLVEYL